MPIHLIDSYNGEMKGIDNRFMKKIAEKLMVVCGVSDHGLGVKLVGDAEMADLNRRYRSLDRPTNVLSFPFMDGAETAISSLPIKELGDIVISVDSAAREAAELGTTVRERIEWLVIHGLLHLLGYDHEISDREAARMEKKEQELAGKLHKARRGKMIHLAINVDHIATIRQARGTSEPDPVTAAAICELAGAEGIVVHLREDRRHIQDRDVRLLRQTVKTKLNLEMGAAREIVDIALSVKPDLVTLVPEKRQELTTEGGLNVIGQKKKLAAVIMQMQDTGIPVSLFIDPDVTQIKAAWDIGATFVEIHTGRYCDAATARQRDVEFDMIDAAVGAACEQGLKVNAGHGLDYRNIARIAALEGIDELSIGHAVVARAALVGLDKAVREMLSIIRSAAQQDGIISL